MRLLLKNLLLFCGILIAVTACKDEPGKHFDMSADDVYWKLINGDMPRQITSKQYSEMGNHYRVSSEDESRTITWRRVWKGKEYYRYRARIIESGENSSRVVVEFMPSDSYSKKPKLSQKDTYGAVVERIYSFVEGRPFDGLKVQRYAMAYAAINARSTVKEISAERDKAIDTARKFGIAVPK